MINDTAQPRDYMALLEAGRAIYPPRVVEDANMLAAQLCDGVEEAAKAAGVRANFGAMSGLEAAHKLARWICNLAPYDYARAKAWLEKEK